MHLYTILYFIFLFFSTCSAQDKTPYSILTGKTTEHLTEITDGYKMEKNAAKAFLKMKNAAAKDGIDIQVVSAYRSYAHQKRIWTNKYKRFTKQGLSPEQAIKKIIEYSTVPGTSRHHWGTDVDIILRTNKKYKDVLLEQHFVEDGAFYPLKKWMDKNAAKFGFYITYTNEKNRKGFAYEPWHYSYLPTSKIYFSDYIDNFVIKLFENEDLIGKDVFIQKFLREYIQFNIRDINPVLK